MAKKRKKTSNKSSVYTALSFIKGAFGFIGKSIMTLFLVMAITGSIVAIVLSLAVIRLVDTNQLVDISPEQLSYTSIIYANNKETNEVEELLRLHGNENRIWTDISHIPKHTRDAFVAIEDKRFYEHGGVDWYRTAGAALNFFVGFWDKVQGASTIHQQLIKNVTGEDDVRADRKVQEIFSAVNLDKNHSKDEILEAYLNTISLGNNTNGVQAAANLYFGKDVSELTIAESACLASITQNPSKYDPSRNLDKNRERQKRVLENMLEQGYINQAEYDQAINEELNIVMDKSEDGVYVYTSKYSYAEEYLIDQVIQDLMVTYDYTEAKAKNEFYNGGLRIYSTIDARIQDTLDQKYTDYDGTFAPYISNNLPVQSAFVVMSTNGEIYGMVGGTGTKEVDRGFNRATMSARQPGSTMKPLGVYSLGIDYNLITYSTMFEDKKLAINDNGSIWSPKNYYGGYKGRMTVDMALRNSVNTVAVQVGQMVGPQNSFNFLTKDLKISTLYDEVYIENRARTDIALAPMTIGATTTGVTPLEWTGAYQIFFNGGYFTKPYAYTLVTDSEGNEILRKDTTATRVIGEDTATVMNKMLQNVVYGVSGTGGAAKNITTTRVAGKTGTSNEDIDQWFVGGTGDYVAGIWIGFDINKTITQKTGNYPPTWIWTNVMKDVQKATGNPSTPFPVSSKVKQLRYCTITGNLATDNCPSAIGYYKENNIPPLCTGHDILDNQENSGDNQNNNTQDNNQNNQNQDNSNSSQNNSSGGFVYPDGENNSSQENSQEQSQNSQDNNANESEQNNNSDNDSNSDSQENNGDANNRE